MGDVPGSRGPSCEVATAASVHESFQEVQFLSNICAKDKPFFQAFVQTNAFLAYLQTLHLFGPMKSPFAEAVQGLQHMQRTTSRCLRYVLPKPPFQAEVSEPMQQVADRTAKAAIALDRHDRHGPPLQLHLWYAEHSSNRETLQLQEEVQVLVEWDQRCPPSELGPLEPSEAASTSGLEALALAFSEEDLRRDGSGVAPSWGCPLCCGFYQAANELQHGLPEALATDFWTSAVLLYAALARKLSAPDDFLLRAHLAIDDRPAALPTHRMLSLMARLEPHHLGEILQLHRMSEEPEPPDSIRYARRLLAIANPSALELAEAEDDPALAFVCPWSDEDGEYAQQTMGPAYEQTLMSMREPREPEAPCVELLPFQGPETSVLNHRRFCSWTDRDPELLSQELLRGAFRAAQAPGDSAASSGKCRARRLERLSEPLAELQCCSLQGKKLEVCLSFWLNCLNAATLIAATAPARLGISEAPANLTAWVELLNTAQLEVQGEVMSLAEIEDGLTRSDQAASPSSAVMSDSPPRRDGSRILKRAVAQAVFGIHRPTSGHPPLRLFQSSAVLAQLDLNAVHLLTRQMSVDSWRRKVQVPGFLESLDFEAEALLELMASCLQKAPERVKELEAATSLGPEADRQLLPKAKDLLRQLLGCC